MFQISIVVFLFFLFIHFFPLIFMSGGIKKYYIRFTFRFPCIPSFMFLINHHCVPQTTRQEKKKKLLDIPMFCYFFFSLLQQQRYIAHQLLVLMSAMRIFDVELSVSAKNSRDENKFYIFILKWFEAKSKRKRMRKYESV